MAKLINLLPIKINEASEAGDIVNKISKLTDNNDHTGAAMILAKYLKDNKNVKLLDAIQSIQFTLKHIPAEILQFRTTIVSELLDGVKKKYGNDVYKVISAAF